MFLFSVFSIWTDEKLNLAVVRWKKYDVNNKCRATNYCSQQENECSCFFWSKWGTDFLPTHRNKHKQNIHCVGCTYSVSASNSGENIFPMVRKMLQPLFCFLHFDQCQKKNLFQLLQRDEQGLTFKVAVSQEQLIPNFQSVTITIIMDFIEIVKSCF